MPKVVSILSDECSSVQESQPPVQRRKRANADTESRTGGFWTTTPPTAHDDRSYEVAEWKVGKVSPRAKSCENPRSAADLSDRAGLKCVKERAVALVRSAEIDDDLLAHSNNCFVQEVQHHHGSLPLAAVMDRWPSFSRFGSRQHLGFHR